MKNIRSRAELRRLAERLIKLGKSCGADEVEVHVGCGTEFHVDVRLGAVENLVEAGSRSVGFRVIKDRRTASAGSSDLSWPVLERLMKNAVARTRFIFDNFLRDKEIIYLDNMTPGFRLSRISESDVRVLRVSKAWSGKWRNAKCQIPYFFK